ncbi:hypothetical protein DRP77_00460 [Candidatus Poribacteria bacterium]|nr:MAG: hypothetical protein DRP77_00460 [Candidatus Poribacteria bacterium]
MTKRELVKIISEATGTSRWMAYDIVDILLDSIAYLLAEEGRLTIRGFGTFVVKERAGRLGRNPRTGEVIRIPPKKRVSFKPSPKLIERLN